MPNTHFKNLKRNVTLERNEFGVPQVCAKSQADAYYGLGYIHTIDRRTQMMFARCLAAGRAAEQISASPHLIQSDRYFRRVGIAGDLDSQSLNLSEFHREMLESYRDGVNDALEICSRSIPMWLTGFHPEPWDISSTLLVGKLLCFGALAINQMRSERLIVEMIHAGVSEVGLKELFGGRLDKVDFDLIRSIKLRNNLSDEALDLLTNLPKLSGSNAWAVSPKRSASGNALMCSDPHLESNRFPSVWYEAILQWDDGFLMGASLPGCPLFAVCRSKNIAWGVTHMKGDCVDYFIEDCRRNDDGIWEYRRGENWTPFQIRREVIKVRSKSPIEMSVYRSDVATLEVDPESQGTGLQLGFQWTGSFGDASEAIGVWLDVTRAKSVREGMDITSECTQPTLCWTMADVDGHIGMQSSGRFPIRHPDHNGLTPIPAWDEQNHWQGWTTPSDLFSVYDPPEGFVATANEELPLVNGRMLITQPYPDYRRRRIVDVLAERPNATLDEMKSLHYDFVSTHAKDLMKVFGPAIGDDERAKSLRAWDGNFSLDSKEAALFHHLYHEVVRKVFGKETGMGEKRIEYLTSLEGYSVMMVAVFDRTLAKEDSWWWSQRDKATLIRESWKRVLENVDEETTWEKTNRFNFFDRFLSSLTFANRLGLKGKEEGMPGNHSTPFQGHVTIKDGQRSAYAPAFHFITDLGEEIVHTNLAGGPSESPFSRYYKSDLKRWREGEYKEMKIDRSLALE